MYSKIPASKRGAYWKDGTYQVSATIGLKLKE